MSELGLKSTAKYKKSARTVGDVLGKFTRMVTNHVMRPWCCWHSLFISLPLIDGQGNWGSLDDPKSFAAMRYTEAKLSPYAQILLVNSVKARLNGSKTLMALYKSRLCCRRLPNMLLNGASGIAVGMATDIPPHNMREVIAACVHILTDEAASSESILEHIAGPDYPTGGQIITPQDEIREIYRLGRGAIKLRAR